MRGRGTALVLVATRVRLEPPRIKVRPPRAASRSVFIVEGKDATIAYSDDTGPTDRSWDPLNQERRADVLPPDLVLSSTSTPVDTAHLGDFSGPRARSQLASCASKVRAR